MRRRKDASAKAVIHFIILQGIEDVCTVLYLPDYSKASNKKITLTLFDMSENEYEKHDSMYQF